MAPKPTKSSSSSEDTGQAMHQRRQRRMQSNRESARRSRMRKQKHLDDLIGQVATLQNDNGEILSKMNVATEHYVRVEAENTILRTQLMELTDRLQSLNSVLRIVEDVSGYAMDIPEIPDPLLKPWQLPCPSQPIIASADMFLC